MVWLFLASALAAEPELDSADTDGLDAATEAPVSSSALDPEVYVYRVGAGDTLRVEVFGEEGLSREVRVPPTCRIELQLIGSVAVCGLGTREIATEIVRGYAAGFLKNPVVFVDVAQYGSQRVEVKGAVKKPGVYVLEGLTTLSEIISLAGGPESASVFKVTVSGDAGRAEYNLAELDLRPERVYVQAGEVVNLHPGLNVSVFGEVKKAGPVPYRQGMTVTEALGEAGGATDSAGLARAYIRRAGAEGRERVNIRRIQRGRAPDPVMQPGDQLVVRRSLL